MLNVALRVADDDDELGDVIFGRGFEGGVTDLEVGPDEYLYVVSGYEAKYTGLLH